MSELRRFHACCCYAALVLLGAVLVLAALLPAAAYAEDDPGVVASGQCGDDARWQLDELGTLTVSGTGPTYDYRREDSPLLNLARDSILRIVVTEGITALGDNLGTEKSSATRVELAASVTSVGANVFRSCEDLRACAFASGSRLSSIGDSAFYRCVALSSFSFPPLLESIGGYAFYYSGLKHVALAGNARLTSIAPYAFESSWQLVSVDLPASLETLGAYAFNNCTVLAGVGFPNGSSLAVIEEGTFKYTVLTTFEVPASVTAIGANAFFSSKLESLAFAEGSKLATVGPSAFRGNQKLKSVKIPAAVRSIASYAFAGCTALESLSFADGSQLTNVEWTALYGCNGLKSIQIPASVTTIDDDGVDALANLKKLESIYVGSKELYSVLVQKLEGSSVRVMGTSSEEKSDLRYISDTYGVIVLGYDGSASTLDIPSAIDGRPVVEIGAYAFDGAATLETVNVPATVSKVGKGAFAGAGRLKSVRVPTLALFDAVLDSGLTRSRVEGSMRDSASGLRFVTCDDGVAVAGCDAAAVSLTVPERFGAEPVTRIVSTFAGCPNLTAVALPSTLRDICEGAFSGCAKLTGIEIPAAVQNVGARAFAECTALRNVTFSAGSQLAAVPDRMFEACSSLQGIELPASVTSIGANAFSGCSGLSSLAFEAGSKLAGIGSYAFRACTGLQAVAFPKSLASLGAGAFYGCTRLSGVVFEEGSACASIGNVAFSACSALSTAVLPPLLASIGDSAFLGCRSLASVTLTSPSSTRFGTGCFTGLAAPSVISVKSQGDFDALSSNAGLLDVASTTVVMDGAVQTRSVANALVSIPEGIVYSGEPIVPEVRVSLNGKTLVKDVDYQLIIASNVNAGRASVMVVGIGAYTGYLMTGFDIGKMQVAVPAARDGIVFDGAEHEGVAAGAFYTLGGQLRAVEAGTYTVIATLKDEKNCMWNDGRTGPVAVEWIIADAAALGTEDPGGSSAPDEGEGQGGQQPGGTPQSPGEDGAKALAAGKTFKKGSSGLRYRVLRSGASPTVALIGAKKGVKSVTVPKAISYKGCTYKVVRVAAKALKGCKKLGKLTLGAAVSAIGKQAFFKCGKLKRIVIKSKKLKRGSVGKKAFSGLHAKAKVKVPASKVKAYRSLLRSKGLSKKAKVGA